MLTRAEKGTAITSRVKGKPAIVHSPALAAHSHASVRQPSGADTARHSMGRTVDRRTDCHARSCGRTAPHSCGGQHLNQFAEQCGPGTGRSRQNPHDAVVLRHRGDPLLHQRGHDVEDLRLMFHHQRMQFRVVRIGESPIVTRGRIKQAAGEREGGDPKSLCMPSETAGQAFVKLREKICPL